ncbi:MAG: hypothetical protein QXQ79_00915 [Candidatus Nanoarchaeia archaeon]
MAGGKLCDRSEQVLGRHTGDGAGDSGYEYSTIQQEIEMKNRYSYIFWLLKRAGLGKEELEGAIRQLTDGRTKSLKSLSHLEILALTRIVRAWANGDKLPIPCQAGQQAKTEVSWQRSNDVKRKKVIALLRTLGYEKDGKADMERIYGWVEKYGVCNPKKLNDYCSDELNALITQVEEMLRKRRQP